MSETFGEDEGRNKQKDTVTLPSREEMLERLKQVDDSPYMQEKFYPLLLRHAGSPKVPQGVVVILTLALADYTKEMPPQAAAGILMNIDGFIDAPVPDADVAQKTKDLWKEQYS
ncbi:MAG: hypothetical protein Q7S50_02355 [bacterium]|nr:hypothetical protein [bacterium]